MVISVCALPVGQSLKGNVAPNLRQGGFCYATQETTNHALCTCPLAQQVWNKVLSLFLTTNVGCLFSWGVLHSSLMCYEVGDIHEAMTIHNRRLILVRLFQQPREQMQSAHIWKPLDGTHHLNIHNEKPLDGTHLGHIDYSCSHPCKDSIIHYKDPHTFTARRKPLVTRMQKLIIIGCRNISCSTSKQCVEYTGQ